MKAASFRETSHVAAGNTKHKVQPGAPGPGGHARPGRGGHAQPQSCMVPMATVQRSCFSTPQGVSCSPLTSLPLPAQPQDACSPGLTPDTQGGRTTQERRGRFFTSEEVKPGCGSLPALPGNLCKLKTSRLGHSEEGGGPFLGVLQEAECTISLRGHRWDFGAQALVSKAT